MPLALYGRAPIWVYTAIAVARNVTWQFDIRLGWVRTPHLALAGASEHPVDQPVEFEIRDDLNARATLVVRIGNYYLDYKSTESLKPPSLPQDRHVVLDGRMPFWLATALARAYRHCASVDAIQPQELRAPRPHAAPDAQCTLSVSSG
jgi:CRISPR-associated protein Csx3